MVRKLQIPAWKNKVVPPDAAVADGRWSPTSFGPLPYKTGLHREKADQALFCVVDVYLLNITHVCTLNDELKLYLINVLKPLAE